MPPPQPVRPPSPTKSLGNLHPGMLASSLSQGVGDRFGEWQELMHPTRNGETGSERAGDSPKLTQPVWRRVKTQAPGLPTLKSEAFPNSLGERGLPAWGSTLDSASCQLW